MEKYMEIVKLNKSPFVGSGVFLIEPIFIEDGEPFYSDEYDHSKSFPEKLLEIIEYTTVSMRTIHDLYYCLEQLRKLPKSYVRKRIKLLDEAHNLRVVIRKNNAKIRRIAKGIDVII